MAFGGLELKGPELFEQVTPAQVGLMAGQVLSAGDMQPQKELRKLKPMWGLLIQYAFHFRVVGLAGFAGVLNAEFPAGAIDRIRIEGSSQRFPGYEPYNVNGASGYQYHNLFAYRPISALVSVAGAAYVQALGPGATRPANPTGGAATTDYDVVMTYLVPFIPLGVLDPLQQAAYLLDARDWNPLILHLYLADQTGLIDNTANISAATFGALQGPYPSVAGAAGSGAPAAPTGAPQANIHLIRPNLRAHGLEGNKAIGSRLCVRTFQPVTSPLQAGVLTDGLIARLNVTGGKRARTLRVVVKTGVKPTTAPTSGVGGVINGLSDSIITQPFLKRAGVRIREPYTTAALKEYFSIFHETPIPIGYFLVDFLEHGDVRTAFNYAVKRPDGSIELLTRDEWTIEGAVPTVTATQIGEVLEEREIRS